MSKLSMIYPQAIEHTKMKIFEDIDHYLESKESIPPFHQYLSERCHYVEQIWINVWLNKVTNDVPKNEKKQFLMENGFEVHGIDRKLLNKLFRNEMRSYQPFDAMQWVEDVFEGNEEIWTERFQEAKVNFVKREKQKKLDERKYAIRMEIEDITVAILEEQYEQFYVHVRYFVAKHLAVDESQSVESNLLESLISDYLTVLLPQKILEQLPDGIKTDFYETFHEKLSSSFVRGSIAQVLYDIEGYFLEDIQEEYLSDLLRLAEFPFELEQQLIILEKDLLAREQRQKEEEEERKRKKEAEERMMKDIFAAEYDPALKRHVRYVLHIGETNTGKTHHALERIKQAASGLYLAPLRLLALEVFDKLNAEGTPCSLKTGEEEKTIPGANHISCTVEMFHEKEYYEVVVIDEAQMITDKDRGFSWYKAITNANAEEVHIIGSKNCQAMLLQLLGDADISIHEYSRDTPLEVEKKEFHIKQIKKGDALICFSRRRVLETASRLQNDGHSVSMIYGSMPPETRKKQIQQFNSGKTKVIVATDAIGMGLNLPIRRIVFLENDKFDGTRRRLLTSQEVKQIAGRAGRKGIYDIGKVSFTSNIKKMRDLLLQEDAPVLTFAIAPTNSVFERFQRYYRDLGTFFELWGKFESPKGTKKASLAEERALYQKIAGTEIEARLPLMDLYGFLHLPFSKNESALTKQWEETMYAIVQGSELPEPVVKEASLEDLELSYKAIGLHLLFLYRLSERTEAIYWERLREEISSLVQERLKTDIKKFVKKCKSCGRKLSWDHSFPTCDACHAAKYRRYRYDGNDV